MKPNLKEHLAEWTDFDGAMFCVARSLCIMGPEVSGVPDAKHVFWSANPVGDTLCQMLQQMVSIGVLEFDEDESRFRWNQKFKGSWEK
jgi:hypothetical protein